MQNVSRVFATDVTAKEISESRVPLTVNLGIARRRLAGLRFDTDLGPKGKERICGEDMKFVYSLLLARGDRGYWVPDAEIVHPFPFDRLKFAPILRHYRQQVAPFWSKKKIIYLCDPPASIPGRRSGLLLAESRPSLTGGALDKSVADPSHWDEWHLCTGWRSLSGWP